MKFLIQFFSTRHLLTNLFFVGILLIAAFSWNKIGKEEMPEFAMDWLRVVVSYPGAPAEDVELFVTKPIEEELKSVSGIEEISSTSSLASSSFRISINPNVEDKKEVIQEIKDAVLRVKLPDDVREIPRFRQFKSSEKAIIDIALVHKKKKVLDYESRLELQKYAHTFENQIVAQPQISSIEKSGYLEPELQVLIRPSELNKYQISISEVFNQIRKNHIRTPIGSLNDREESKVTALNELDTVESLENLILKGSYTGPRLKLSQIADIAPGFERVNSIYKVNGHEAIILNVKKSISSDILTAKDAVVGFVDRFNKINSDSNVSIYLMDDESSDVQNRLSIITWNMVIGFVLIFVVLMLFLNPATGFWVASGIPFSLAFTIICAFLFGYTVNNITLCGIIIVLGIVVDDAIIVAENITRYKEAGVPLHKAAVDATLEVFSPILASIVTTCIAFLPLFFFDGHFGKFVSYMPLMVILMLIGSLIESYFILPAHLSGKTPFLDKFSYSKNTWFLVWEKRYSQFLEKILNFRIPILLGALILIIGLFYLFATQMKFSMFPREESSEVFVKVETAEGTNRYETAYDISGLDDMFYSEGPGIVTAVRSRIGQSRRGGAVKENEAGISVELTRADEREVSLKQLKEKWTKKSKEFKELSSVKILNSRWGRDSGSAIELQVQENNDELRAQIAKKIKEYMDADNNLEGVELERPLIKKEFIFKIDQGSLIRFDIDPNSVTTALRTFVEGTILYTINKGDEEVELRLTVPDSYKLSLDALLKLKVENKQKQLILLDKFISIEEVKRPVNISRINGKRTIVIYADVKPGSGVTPLEAAEKLEAELFPLISKSYPSSILKFIGEIEDSRDSQSNFRDSLILVVFLIYFVLIIMFNSLTTPFLILAIIPFGLGGAIMVLITHGMSVYGFFGAIGALGMIGVVINDSIIMIDKLERSFKDKSLSFIDAATSRLRPVIITTLTTMAAILPTAYGFAGYDSMLSEMMLVMGWGLAFATVITLVIIPCLYSLTKGKNYL